MRTAEANQKRLSITVAVDVVNRREKLERGLVLLLMENSYVFPPKAQMCMLCGASEGHFYTAYIH